MELLCLCIACVVTSCKLHAIWLIALVKVELRLQILMVVVENCSDTKEYSEKIRGFNRASPI